MIRIYMSLRETSSNYPAQSYPIGNDGSKDSYSLCLRGMCRSPDEISLTDWPFMLSPKISEQLADIALHYI
ncbi:hypothetical protein F442_08242 [Phytophthora nicotianae P10297]|uniref:Uncharacterized protein n=1 Tax=Phytophthora nicotianae P10297 TaxID=1317064 RepID=W2ZDK3_PHYNI|nr:hypothetical protein F442_08242 [Phytophthora nicotianae P10297]